MCLRRQRCPTVFGGPFPPQFLQCGDYYERDDSASLLDFEKTKKKALRREEEIKKKEKQKQKRDKRKRKEANEKVMIQARAER